MHPVSAVMTRMRTRDRHHTQGTHFPRHSTVAYRRGAGCLHAWAHDADMAIGQEGLERADSFTARLYDT
jgi:hypothetical protein